MLPPVEVDGTKTAVTASVGETLNVTSKGVTKVSTDNDQVLQVSQPHSSGGAEFNGGALVVGPGTATLMVDGKNGTLYTVTVTASS